MKYIFLLVATAFLLTACQKPIDPGPPPCEGEDCPQPCETTEKARIFITPKGSLSVTSDFQDCYVAGQTINTSTTIVGVDEAQLQAPRFKVVIDVVDRSEGGSFLDKLVASQNDVTATPNIFEGTLTASEVKQGVTVNVSVKVKPDARTAEDYSLVISFFRVQDGDDPEEVAFDQEALAGSALDHFRLER